jgi:hypothetical protein
MPDVDHDQVPHFVSREQVAAAGAAEGDRHISPGGAVDNPGKQIHAGGPVDGDDGDLEVNDTVEEGGDRRARRSGSAGPEQCIYR